MPYRLLAGSEGLDEASAGWRALESRAPCHPFQTYEFCRTWYQCVGERGGATPLIAAYEEDGETLGLFPASVMPYGPVRLLAWMAAPYLIDFGDVLFDGSSAGTSAAEFVEHSLSLLRSTAHGTVLCLNHVRSDAIAFETLDATQTAFKRDPSLYVPIVGDFDAYFSSLSGNARHNVRKALRRLQGSGEVRFRILAKDDPDFDRVATRFVELRERRRGASRPGHADFRMEQARSEPSSTFAILTLNGAIIATDLIGVRAGRMYSVEPAFDDEFASHAPGKVLFYHLIRHCFEQGFDVFDFACGGESYKYQWTHDEVPLTTFVSGGVQGLVLKAASETRRRLRAPASAGSKTGRPR